MAWYSRNLPACLLPALGPGPSLGQGRPGKPCNFWDPSRLRPAAHLAYLGPPCPPQHHQTQLTSTLVVYPETPGTCHPLWPLSETGNDRDASLSLTLQRQHVFLLAFHLCRLDILYAVLAPLPRSPRPTSLSVSLSVSQTATCSRRPPVHRLYAGRESLALDPSD